MAIAPTASDVSGARSSSRLEALRASTGLHVGAWVARYGVAEVVGIAGAVGAAWLARAAGGGATTSAFAGAVGESVGYYAAILLQELRAELRLRAAGATGRWLERAWSIAGRLTIEFGPAEALDTLLVRPLAMRVGMALLGLHWGVLAGKLAADVVFYVPVLVVYERRRARARRAG